MPNFGGRAASGTMTPKFELGRDFCTMHLSPKFHHPVFTCSEVLTNKQTDAAENIQRSSLRYSIGLILK